MIYCCQCEKDIDLEETVRITGLEAYPNCPFEVDGWYIKCKHCGNFVGTHQETGKPLGCIATQEIKNARIHIHNLIDPLWRSKKISRTKLYKTMSEKLGYKYHTANTRTIDECRRVYKVGLEIRRHLTAS